MTYGEIFFELLFGYAILFGVVKILGKTQINQITTFDFISALVLGNLLGDAIYDKEADFWRIAFSLVVWGAFIFITGTYMLENQNGFKCNAHTVISMCIIF